MTATKVPPRLPANPEPRSPEAPSPQTLGAIRPDLPSYNLSHLPYTGLADFIGHLHAMPKQQCPAPTVLGANVVPGPDSPLTALPKEQQIKSYTIKTFPNGERVGIVGMPIPTTLSVPSAIIHVDLTLRPALAGATLRAAAAAADSGVMLQQACRPRVVL